MPKKKTGILRHIADIIIQNKSLSAENEDLNKLNEHLAHEVEKYRELLTKIGNVESSGKAINEKRTSLIRYRTATVLYADVLGFEHFSPQMDPKLVVDSLDEIFIKLQQIVSKFAVKNIRTIGDSLMCIGGIPNKNITNHHRSIAGSC